MKKLIDLLFKLLFILFLACEKEDENKEDFNIWDYNVPQKIIGDWETASLEDEGFDIKPFSYMMSLLLKNENNHNYHSILVIRNNKLVFETYFKGYDRHYISSSINGTTVFNKDTLHHMASVSKSITSACMGIAIDKGYINSIEDKIISYFPEYS